MLNGYKIGMVGKISLKNDNSGKLIVTLLMDSDMKIPKNSIAKVSSDFLGPTAVQLILGSSSEYAQNGDTLKSAQEEDLKTSVNRTIAPLQEKAVSLISSIDSMVIVVREIFNETTQQNLAKSFESIRTTIASIQTTSYRLDTIVRQEKNTVAAILTQVHTLTTTLSDNSDKISEVINNFASISDSLARANITSTINNADKALSQTNAVMTKINSGQGTMGMLVNNDSLYRNLARSTEDLDKLLVDLREHPSRYVRVSVFGGKKEKDKKK
jgi:phospholipid/cholesterol/gamma-HCH transport system substrate-binding protein